MAKSNNKRKPAQVDDWVEIKDSRAPSEIDDWETVQDWEEISESEPPGAMSSLGRGVSQGLLLDFRDELAGAMKSPIGAVKRAASYVGYRPDEKDTDVSEYTAERDESRRLDDLARKAHPKLFGSGELGGAIASSFVPGVGVAKGASLGKGLLQSAKIGGLIGAGASKGDTALDLAGSTAGGALGGAAGHALGAAGAKALGVISKPVGKLGTKLKDFAENRAVKQAGAMLKDERGLKHQNRLSKTGRMLLDEGIVTPLARVEKVKARVEPMIQEAGEALGAVEAKMDAHHNGLKELGADWALINPTQIASRMEAEIINPIRTSPALGGYAPGLSRMVRRLRDFGDDISFSEANRIKREFDDLVKYDREQTAPKEFIKRLRGILNEEIEKHAENISEMVDDPIIDIYRKNKERYGILQKIHEMADDKMSRNEANRWLAPSDYASLATGGLIGSQNDDTLGTALTFGALNRAGRTYGNALSSTMADRLSKRLAKPNTGLIDMIKRTAAIQRAQGE